MEDKITIDTLEQEFYETGLGLDECWYEAVYEVGSTLVEQYQDDPTTLGLLMVELYKLHARYQEE